MTIINESTQEAKYSYLEFVEFQEMLCRVAILGFDDIYAVEFKVFMFIDLIWDYMINGINKWKPETYPLICVNQDIEF